MENIGVELTKVLLAQRGERVAMDSEYCKQYKAAHSSCTGCEQELPCAKFVLIGMVGMKFEESFHKMLLQFQEKAQEVLEAESVEEAKAIVEHLMRL